jgi:deoxycytidine triphosphate deaminase
MILSDRGIKTALQQGDIEIDPVPGENLYTTSAVDLTLGDQFQAWNEEILERLETEPERTIQTQFQGQNSPSGIL